MVAVDLSKETILKAAKILKMSPTSTTASVAAFYNVSIPTLNLYAKKHNVTFKRGCRICGKDTKGISFLYCSDKCLNSTKKRSKSNSKYDISECVSCGGFFLKCATHKTCGFKECILKYRRYKNKYRYKDTRSRYAKKYLKENKDYFTEWRNKNQTKINKRQRVRRTGSSDYTWGTREKAIKMGYRSWFEVEIANQLTEMGIDFEYEPDKIPYKTDKARNYIPDFKIKNKNGVVIYLEAKGLFSLSNLKKTMAVIYQNDINLMFVFQSNGKVFNEKKKKVTNCKHYKVLERHGIQSFLYRLPEDFKEHIDKLK